MSFNSNFQRRLLHYQNIIWKIDGMSDTYLRIQTLKLWIIHGQEKNCLVSREYQIFYISSYRLPKATTNTKTLTFLYVSEQQQNIHQADRPKYKRNFKMPEFYKQFKIQLHLHMAGKQECHQIWQSQNLVCWQASRALKMHTNSSLSLPDMCCQNCRT